MSDVFSLYPHPPAPQQVQNPAETLSAVGGAALRINEAQMVRLQMQTKKLDNLRVSLGGLLANPNLTREDIIQETHNLVASNTIDAGMATNFLARLPQDMGQAKQYLMQHTVQAMSAYDQAQTLMGPASLVNQGGVQTPIRAGSGIPGAGIPAHVTGPSLANTLSPGEAAAPRTQVDVTTGQPQTTTTGDVTGGAPQLPPGAGNLMPGSQGTPGGTPVAGPVAPSPTRPTGLGGGAQLYQAHKAAAPAMFQDAQNYEQIVDLTRAVETSTGPIGPLAQRVQSFLSQITGQAQPLLTTRAAMQEELGKYLTRGQTPVTAGQSTDLQRVQGIEGSANANLTNAGNNAIALRDLGVRRLNAYAPTEFSKETDPRYMMATVNGPVPDPEKYNTWLTQKYYPGHDWSGMVTDKMTGDQLKRVRDQASSQVTPEMIARVKKGNPGMPDAEARRQAGWLTPFGQSILSQRENKASNPMAPIAGGTQPTLPGQPPPNNAATTQQAGGP
jgi:hypothetical protein